MSPEEFKHDRLMKEFEQAASLHNFENGLQLGQFVVYLTVIGALVTARANQQPQWPTSYYWALDIAGVLATLAFTVIVERAADFMHGARRRMQQLERSLGFQLYQQCSAKERVCLSATNGLRFQFCVVLCGCGLDLPLADVWQRVIAAVLFIELELLLLVFLRWSWKRIVVTVTWGIFGIVLVIDAFWN